MAPLGRTITLNPARRRLHGSKGTPAALQPVAYIYACLQWNTPAPRKPQVPLFPLPVPVFPGASPPWITDLPMTNSHCMPSPCRARHTCVSTWLVRQYTTFTMLACTAQPSTLYGSPSLRCGTDTRLEEQRLSVRQHTCPQCRLLSTDMTD